MPQIAQIAATYASQIFWMLVVFGLIYFGIGKAMLPKIEAVMDSRDRKIADDLAAARSAREMADETEEAYRTQMNEARAVAQKATAEAKSAAALETEGKVKAADAASAGKMADAEARLREAEASATAEIETVAAEAARDIVERLSGVAVEPERARGAVRAALAE